MLDKQLPPKDTVIEILARLPVKSLVRFRGVSKYLCAMIKSPIFINKHFVMRGRNNSVLLMRRYFPSPVNDDTLSFHNPNSPELEEEVWPKLSIPFLKDIRFKYDTPYFPEGVHLLGPCNGLISICCDEYVILCNPALRKFKKLYCPFQCPKGFSLDILVMGFGNNCIDCVKVVLIRNIDPDRRNSLDYPYIIAHLYNSHSNSWKHIEGDAMGVKDVFPNPRSGLFLNGACHWSAYSFSSREPDTILSFDINNEVFRQFEYPDSLENTNAYYMCLNAYKECLSIIRYQFWMKEPELIDIWVMKEYGAGDSWIKQFVIGPHVVISSFLFWKNDEWLLLDNGHGQLASCALHSDEIKKFQVGGADETLRVLLYNESLINLI